MTKCPPLLGLGLGCALLSGCASAASPCILAGNSGGLLRAEPDGDAWQATAAAAVENVLYLAPSLRRGCFYVLQGNTPSGEGALYLADAALQPLCDAFPTGGAESCHLAIAPGGRFAYVANYSSASIAEIALDADGLPQRKRVIRHEGASVAPRQEQSHPHQVIFTPDGRILAAVDLGIDAIVLYRFDSERGIDPATAERVPLPPGSGPRHLVFSPDGKFAYVANELNSTVAVFSIENAGWTLRETLPAGNHPETPGNYPAAIRLSPGGHFVAVSNRGEDTLALFAVGPDGLLTRHGEFKLNARWPRDFDFSPDGRQAVVCCEHDGKVLFCDWDEAAGAFSEVHATLPLSGALAVLFDPMQ